MQSRYYNPEWGRFLNADGMISTGQGLLSQNMYAYCLNNPINMADPNGSTAIVNVALLGLTIASVGKKIVNLGAAIITQQKLTDIGFENITIQSAIQFNDTLKTNNIAKKEHIAAFLAQCAYETNYGTWLTEIGSEVYFANTEYGYKYRGAGYIQITWDYNYRDFANAMGDPEIYNQGADYVASNYAWAAAGWFWSKNNINDAFDNGGFDATSRKINYYDTGSFSTRRSYYNKILSSW